MVQEPFPFQVILRLAKVDGMRFKILPLNEQKIASLCLKAAFKSVPKVSRCGSNKR